MALIGSVCNEPKNSYSNSAYEKGDPDLAKQKGLPVGYDSYDTDSARAGWSWNLVNAPNPPGTATSYTSQYSVPGRYTYGNPKTVPTMIVTAAETNLLLAESAVRTWVTGSEDSYYKAGVRAAMEQFKFYSGATELYDRYLSAPIVTNCVNMLSLSGSDDEKLEAINTQYYITTFCDEYEAFANWRRNGYPELTPVIRRRHM